MHRETGLTKLSETVLESQKVAQTNAETLHSLLVGIENLGENVKKYVGRNGSLAIRLSRC